MQRQYQNLSRFHVEGQNSCKLELQTRLASDSYASIDGAAGPDANIIWAVMDSSWLSRPIFVISLFCLNKNSLTLVSVITVFASKCWFCHLYWKAAAAENTYQAALAGHIQTFQPPRRSQEEKGCSANYSFLIRAKKKKCATIKKSSLTRWKWWPKSTFRQEVFLTFVFLVKENEP